MKCSNCGAALSGGTEANLLNCAFCGAVQRNPDAGERRPIDDLLDSVFAETGDAAYQVRVETTVTKTSVTDVGAGAVLDKSSPEVRDALRETRRALTDIFGEEQAPAPARPVAATVTEIDVEAEPTTDAAPTAPAPMHYEVPEYSPEERRNRPHIVLGGRDDNPEWTRYLIPFLVLALLGGAGVAGLAALLLH